MANSCALACASGVELVPLEYSSMSNARRERLEVYLVWSQLCACNKGAVTHVVFGIIVSYLLKVP